MRNSRKVQEQAWTCLRQKTNNTLQSHFPERSVTAHSERALSYQDSLYDTDWILNNRHSVLQEICKVSKNLSAQNLLKRSQKNLNNTY